MSYTTEGGPTTSVELTWYDLDEIRRALIMAREHHREQSHRSGIESARTYHKETALRLRKLGSRISDAMEFGR